MASEVLLRRKDEIAIVTPSRIENLDVWTAAIRDAAAVPDAAPRPTSSRERRAHRA